MILAWGHAATKKKLDTANLEAQFEPLIRTFSDWAPYSRNVLLVRSFTLIKLALVVG